MGRPNERFEDPLITVTSGNQANAWAGKKLPACEEVRPGVWAIPVPIPDSSLVYTLCYLALDGEGAIVIDPGWNSEQGWDHLVRGFRQAGCEPSRVSGIIVTHKNADHVGLAGRLKAVSGAWIGMGAEDARSVGVELGDVLALHRQQLVRWGVPETKLEEIVPTRRMIENLHVRPHADLVLADGEMVPGGSGVRLKVVTTPGHTAGHVSIVDEDRQLLFSGDHILPGITPNISLDSEGESDPLRSYLASLRKLVPYNHHEVLPAHEFRFQGLGTRIDMLTHHTRQRLDEVHQHVGRGKGGSVWELAQRLHWKYGWDRLNGQHLRLALGETAACVAYLRTAGQSLPVRVAYMDRR